MRKDDALNQKDFNLELFNTLMNNEVRKLKDLPTHPNIIQLVEYDWDGVQITNDGERIDILYVVLELAEGGDLFSHILTLNKGLPENIARFYFKRLIDALEFLH